MFGLGPATNIYIAVEAVDMRKGFEGLYGLVRDRFGQDTAPGLPPDNCADSSRRKLAESLAHPDPHFR